MEAELIESISAKRRKRRSEFTRSHPALSALSPSYSSFPRSVFVSPSPPSLPLSSHLGGFWFPINHHSTYCSNQGHVSMCCNLTPLWLKIGCFCRKCGEIHTLWFSLCLSTCPFYWRCVIYRDRTNRLGFDNKLG